MKVVVPVVEVRKVVVNNYFEVEDEKHAQEIIDWIKENGLVELQPCCEEIVETCEVDTVETLIDEIKIIKNENKKEGKLSQIFEKLFALFEYADELELCGENEQAEELRKEIDTIGHELHIIESKIEKGERPSLDEVRDMVFGLLDYADELELCGNDASAAAFRSKVENLGHELYVLENKLEGGEL